MGTQLHDLLHTFPGQGPEGEAASSKLRESGYAGPRHTSATGPVPLSLTPCGKMEQVRPPVTLCVGSSLTACGYVHYTIIRVSFLHMEQVVSNLH